MAFTNEQLQTILPAEFNFDLQTAKLSGGSGFFPSSAFDVNTFPFLKILQDNNLLRGSQYGYYRDMASEADPRIAGGIPLVNSGINVLPKITAPFMNPYGYTGDDRFSRAFITSYDNPNGFKAWVDDKSNPANYFYGGMAGGGGRGSIWDSIFQGPFNPVKYLNPISGGMTLNSLFSESPGTVIEKQEQLLIAPPPVNYIKLGTEAGVNVAGSIGFGFGLESATSAFANYGASTVPLAEGVQGPVNPGFWGSVNSGDFFGALDNIKSPLMGIVHQPSSIFPNRGVATTADIAIGQIVTVIAKSFGNIGQAITQALSGDFMGALASVGIINSPKPGSPSSTIGNLVNVGSGSGGAGGNSGYGYTPQAKQSSLLPLFIGVGLFLGVIYLVLRKR